MGVVQETCESCTFGCPTCPCRWVAVAPVLFDLVENEFGHGSINYPDGRNGNHGHVETAQVRFRLYREYTHIAFGYLGRGIRRKLPPCVDAGIKVEYPDASDAGSGDDE